MMVVLYAHIAQAEAWVPQLFGLLVHVLGR
jgi:hypothetical protein